MTDYCIFFWPRHVTASTQAVSVQIGFNDSFMFLRIKLEGTWMMRWQLNMVQWISSGVSEVAFHGAIHTKRIICFVR